MRMRLLLCMGFFLFAVTYAFGEHISLAGTENDLNISVLESNDAGTFIKLEIGGFDKLPISINGEEYYSFHLGKEHILLNSGEPALPQVCRSIIIPDNAEMDFRIISSEYEDFPATPIMPSKGNLLRTVNPDEIPYQFGEVYSSSEWYPSAQVKLRQPYILRDYRGIVIEINPFQYLPSEKILRVYKSISIEIFPTGAGTTNVLDRDKNEIRLIPDFNRIYERHFINYANYSGKYTPVEEAGDMLIITHDAFRTDVLPLVEWKKQKGIKTTIVNVSTIGNNSASIKNYIQNFYNTSDLAWVILVGDAAQAATYLVSGDASDPSYAKVAGGDNYPDIIVGRFSAETNAQVQTQVARSINYEKTPVGVDWFHKATGIASSEGPGHYGEYDYQHMGYIRTDLLGYNYTLVDAIYDPGATASQVSAALNNGRSFVNYCGHGSTTAWSTTGFSNSNVTALTNDNMLPFIFSVACVNGDFDGATCFGEAWLRSTHNGNPIGAIAAYMSSVNQSWNPPMDAQDEATDLLVSESKLTVGGLCYNASCKMIDLNGTGGVDMYNTWHIFGDPSVMIRTDDPINITATHSNAVLFTTTSFTVTATGIEDALCALYYNDTLYGAAYTAANGVAVIPISGQLPMGAAINLTITAYNRNPYMANIQVITPEGPFVMYDDHQINDGDGNNDGIVNCGELIAMGVQLVNVGPDTAFDVTALLTAADPYVTITDANEIYGIIPGDYAMINIADAFSFEIAGNTPDSHTVNFTVEITGAGKDTTWTSSISLTVNSPTIGFVSLIMTEIGGNNNGVFDPGESAELTVVLNNNGSAAAINVNGTLSEADTYVSIDDNAGAFGTIALGGGTGNNSSNKFALSADASCPMGHVANLQIALTADGGYFGTVNLDVVVGDRVAFFYDDYSFDMGWTGFGGSGEWMRSPAAGGNGSDTYGGPDPSLDHSATADNFVLGNDLTSGAGGDYNSSLSATYYITSPMFDCSGMTSVQMKFWRWLGVEGSSYDHAYLQAYNGTSWVTLYQNSATMSETSWGEQFFDVSTYADGNQDFQIRFGMGTSDGSSNYCGWNIDDFELKGYGATQGGIPNLAYMPYDFADSVNAGQSIKDTVKIMNNGDALLRIRFSSSIGWLAFDTAQHNVTAGDSLLFEVTLNAGGLSVGDHIGAMQFSSNDPITPAGSIQFNLHIWTPNIYLAQSSVNETVPTGDASAVPLIIINDGPGQLNFNISRIMFNGRGDYPTAAKELATSPLGYRIADADKSESGVNEPFYAPVTRNHGGPDTWGYSWVDSDDSAGPAFAWVDIGFVGIAVTLGDDDTTAAIPIGFDFPFYQNSYNTLNFSSNGIITFGKGATIRTNTNLPNTAVPNNLIAVWWDDLDPRKGGQILYYADTVNDRFIVSYVGIPNYYSTTGTGSLTFQAILYPNGKLILQYGTMDPGVDVDGLKGATIGIENSTGNDGLAVVYNADYIHSNMTIIFNAANWLSVEPAIGTITAFSADTVQVGLNAAELPEGSYSGQLTIASNDPDTPSWVVSVAMTVGPAYICGDANGNGIVNIQDVTTLINFLYKGGPAPNPLEAGDANGNGILNIQDVTYLVNFLYKEGPQPLCP